MLDIPPPVNRLAFFKVNILYLSIDLLYILYNLLFKLINLERRFIMINKEELKKNNFYIIDNGLGAPVKAQLLESPKQGRGWKTAVLMKVYGSSIGFFDEAGSVYTKDILHAA
jgi:hypothetical protein